jgi:hypothetical protein
MFQSLDHATLRLARPDKRRGFAPESRQAWPNDRKWGGVPCSASAPWLPGKQEAAVRVREV